MIFELIFIYLAFFNAKRLFLFLNLHQKNTMFLRNFLLFAFLFLVSCEDCVFTSRNTRLLVLGFYDKNTKEALDIKFDSVKTGFFRHVVSDPKNRSLSGKYFELLMSPASDTSTFYLYKNRRIDTLSVSISRKIALITPDCGRDERLFNLKIVHCTFLRDSLAVPKTDLTIGGQQNIEIYLK